MSDFIGVDIEGLIELRDGLAKLPAVAQDACGDAASKYLLNVFKLYPPKKTVTRKRAYGRTFFSDKQRKWFFANLNEGSIQIPYRRTQGLARAWKKIGSGKKTILVNETEAAVYTMGKGTRSRHEKLVGWETTDEIIKKREKQIDRRVEAAGKKALKKVGFT